MSEYIERQKAYEVLSDYYHHSTMLQHLTLRDALLKVPAADVRPVVLCRDCWHYEMGVCLKIYDDGAANKDAWQERKPEDFCSYGEKREES